VLHALWTNLFRPHLAFFDERPNCTQHSFRGQQLQMFDFCVAPSELLALRKDFLLIQEYLLMQRQDE
jgi:hypothetical protein